MENNKKRKEGSPTKLTEEVIESIRQVISNNILAYTDEELVVEINELLPLESRFGYEAFSKWKRGVSQADNPLYPEFLRLVKKALIKEKQRLLESLEKDKGQWQRFAWILERKFDEWNIKVKQEVDHTVNIPKLPDINISGID